MQSLFDFAESLDIAVELAPLLMRDGEYRDDLKRIRLRQGMMPRLTRSVLAHELAHAVHGDQVSVCGHVSARQEVRADEWAARQLITLAGYREAEEQRGGHAPSMAHDLGVITRLVQAYGRTLLRIGDSVYQRPRMGAGQFDQLVEA